MSSSEKIRHAVQYKLNLEGISQRELSRRVGIAHATICNALNGKHEATLSLWDRVAEALETNLARLLSMDERDLMQAQIERRKLERERRVEVAKKAANAPRRLKLPKKRVSA